MSQKTFYRYNAISGQYERWVAAVVIGVIAILFSLMEFPRERRLRQQNEQLTARLEVLNRRADEALAVMEDIAERDNNFYRVVMQAEPLSRTRRLAGIERQRNFDRLDSLDDYRLVNSVDPVYGTSKFHEGMDFSAPPGTPVYATADGTVASASWQGAYGNLIEIRHGYNYTTRYAHLSKINVQPGQTVHRGDLIGAVGNTGKSTGPHLHYEVRFKGIPQNPVHYYFFDLSPEQYDEIIQVAENAGHVMD